MKVAWFVYVELTTPGCANATVESCVDSSQVRSVAPRGCIYDRPDRTHACSTRAVLQARTLRVAAAQSCFVADLVDAGHGLASGLITAGCHVRSS